MAYEFQDRSNDALYKGTDLEFLLDDETNIGEVYLDGDLIFQAEEVFTEEQLIEEFRAAFEVIEAAPEGPNSRVIEESEDEFSMVESDLEMTEIEIGDLQERLYTKGGEYAIEDEMGNLREFIGDYHIHPKQGAMVGKFHDGRPHALLIEVGFEELKNIRLKGLEPIQQIDYTVEEQVDPDYDDMTHAGSIMLDDMEDMDNDRGDFY
tara:strand:- start:390 stop:1010 length:621 start_codon:yes stop_codon:yes gene_type:complete